VDADAELGQDELAKEPMVVRALMEKLVQREELAKGSTVAKGPTVAQAQMVI